MPKEMTKKQKAFLEKSPAQQRAIRAWKNRKHKCEQVINFLSQYQKDDGSIKLTRDQANLVRAMISDCHR